MNRQRAATGEVTKDDQRAIVVRSARLAQQIEVAMRADSSRRHHHRCRLLM